jgi:AhpD family alkylhydroperoxidase
MKDYPAHHRELEGLIGDLARELPGPMSGFSQLLKSATADGVLAAKTKELIALGIGIAVRCDGCIAYHVHDALRAGANAEEITETIGVAVMMGGGPSVICGSEALEALRQFTAAPAPPA